MICFDTETPTRYYADGIPDVVCLTWAPADDKSVGRIAVGDDALDLWDSWIDSIPLVAHNAPFDVCVMAKAAALRRGTYDGPGMGPEFERVFRAYDRGSIRDTIIDQRLIDIAQGRPGDDTRMGTLAKRLLSLDIGDDKNWPPEWSHLRGTPVQDWPPDAREATPWRFKYGLLAGVPLSSWPDDPRRYACEDPVITWGIADWQDARARKVFRGPIPDRAEQTRAAFDLHLISLHGFSTDRPRVRRLIDIYASVESTCATLLFELCAICGRPLPDAGDCPQCGERVSLIREDVTWAGGVTRQGELFPIYHPERRKRVRDRSAIQRLVWDALGAEAPQTKTCRERGLPKSQATVATDADTLIKVSAALADGRDGLISERATIDAADRGDLRSTILRSSLPLINALRLHSRASKYQSAFLIPLDTDQRVRTSYQSCKDTGRTSARRPNVQNFPRPAESLAAEHQIRSCIVADPGCVFLVCDYAQIELVGFAHVLNKLGEMAGRESGYQSSLARAINGGMDGHIMVAAEVMGIDYPAALELYKRAKASTGRLSRDESLILRWRQVGKIQNYGAAGGMGAKTFVSHASKQDAIISLAESYAVREAWLRAWSPDVPDYFRMISDLTSATGRADITQLYSGRVRGKCTFTQACNTLFQGLCADGAKRAARDINDAVFRDPSSPLFGARPVLFVHDEFVLSCPSDRAASAAPELSRIMIEAMHHYIPDIKISADCSIMDRWGKG